MSRKKRISTVLERSLLRLSGVKSIDPNLDLGNGLSVAVYQAAITDTAKMLDEYNVALSQIDRLMTAVREQERQLKILSERMLSAVGCLFGKTSDEYVMAGGTRRTQLSRIESSLLPASTTAMESPLGATVGIQISDR